MTFTTIRETVTASARDAVEDDVFSLSAAIAYYTLFSLPPVLVVMVAVASVVFGTEAVVEMLAGQVRDLVGPGAGDAIRTMIEEGSSSTQGGGVGKTLVGVAALLFGASGAFSQLRKALNRAWEVEADREGGVVRVVVQRLLSFGMVLTIGFLLLVSLVVSAVLAQIGDAASAVAGAGAAGVGVQVANAAVSLGVITVLFALLFKVLPDAEVAWRDVWVGAAVTALLFTVGKTAIGLYLGAADPGSAFGAAGSLALVLVWIYYSALILLFGAEFTQAWAVRAGDGVHPESPGTDAVHPVAEPREPQPYSSGPPATS